MRIAHLLQRRFCLAVLAQVDVAQASEIARILAGLEPAILVSYRYKLLVGCLCPRRCGGVGGLRGIGRCARLLQRSRVDLQSLAKGDLRLVAPLIVEGGAADYDGQQDHNGDRKSDNVGAMFLHPAESRSRSLNKAVLL